MPPGGKKRPVTLHHLIESLLKLAGCAWEKPEGSEPVPRIRRRVRESRAVLLSSISLNMSHHADASCGGRMSERGCDDVMRSYVESGVRNNDPFKDGYIRFQQEKG